MDASEIICPFCLVRVDKTDGKCCRCGQEIRLKDWTVPKYDNEPDNLYSPVTSDHGVFKSKDFADTGLYIPYPLNVNSKGKLRSDQDPKVYLEEKWLRIGSHVSCTVEVRGTTDAVLCVIVDRNKNNDTPDCWIYNCSKETGIYVNRKRLLRVRKLTNGDRIEVAGVTFKFGVDDGGPYIIAQPNGLESDAEPVIEVVGLTATKSNGDLLLDDISFDVKKGEFVAVMGPSGCGKSSLIQRMAGLAPKDSGVIEPRDGHELVYLPQDVERTLHPAMTLDEEIESYRRIYRLSEDEKEFNDLKEQVLRHLNLIDKVDGESPDRIGDFSGGEMRRVGLALALLRKPKILLLDEPFAGLDPENERKLTDELFKLAKNGNRTIVCVTHGLDNKEVFDRLLILGEGGRKRAYAKSDELLNLDGLLASKRHECPPVNVSQPQEQWLRLKKFCKSAWNDVTRLWCDLCKDLKNWWENLHGLNCAGNLRIVEGYLLRYWKENATPWYRSNFSVCFLWQPLIIVAGIRLACAYNFKTNHTELLTFCIALSLFWLGVINCSRELVRNRVPSRCLERLGGVSTPTYLFSKYLWVLGFCLVQTIVFAVLVWLVAKVPLNLSQWSESKETFETTIWGVSKLDLSLLQRALLFIPMFIACSLGGICGLAMSAIFRSELKATAWATNLAIFALLFSNRMVEIKDICFQKVVWLVKWMPCYWPAQWMEDILSGRSWGSWLQNVKLLTAYLVLMSMIVVFFEWKNERRWQGRTSGAGK